MDDGGFACGFSCEFSMDQCPVERGLSVFKTSSWRGLFLFFREGVPRGFFKERKDLGSFFFSRLIRQLSYHDFLCFNRFLVGKQEEIPASDSIGLASRSFFNRLGRSLGQFTGGAGDFV